MDLYMEHSTTNSHQQVADLVDLVKDKCGPMYPGQGSAY
jgi:hypothetical protein